MLPIWNAGDATPLATDRLPPAQVCVIGAGVAGLSVALALLEARYTVTVIERDAVGAGETSRSTAHLACALDDRYAVIEREHGHDGARCAAESHREAISQIERWVSEYRIDCGFRRLDGHLFNGDDGDPALLECEFDAALRAGLEVRRVQRIERLPALGAALRFARQARIDPLCYVQGLARAVRARGGHLARGEANAIEDGPPCRVLLRDRRDLKCDAVVVCTNVPFHRLVAYHTKQAAYRTFVIAASAPRESIPDALF